jgi:uncharacterized protein (DUF2236 family)
MVWRVARERVLLLGGPAALLMQVAHPLVAAGVRDHSDFRRDPFARLRRTLEPTLTVTFGDRRQASAAAQAVAATHARVHGQLHAPAGRYRADAPYDATNPDLALWVHATLLYSAIRVYRLFVGGLSSIELEAYYREAKRFAEMFGVIRGNMPAGYLDFIRYLASMLDGPDLAVTALTRELGAEILRPPLPAPFGALRAPIRVLTSGLLPERLRREFELPWNARHRAAFRTACLATRGGLRALPWSARHWPHYRVAVARMRAPAGRRTLRGSGMD